MADGLREALRAAVAAGDGAAALGAYATGSLAYARILRSVERAITLEDKLATAAERTDAAPRRSASRGGGTAWDTAGDAVAGDAVAGEVVADDVVAEPAVVAPIPEAPVGDAPVGDAPVGDAPMADHADLARVMALAAKMTAALATLDPFDAGEDDEDDDDEGEDEGEDDDDEGDDLDADLDADDAVEPCRSALDLSVWDTQEAASLRQQIEMIVDHIICFEDDMERRGKLRVALSDRIDIIGFAAIAASPVGVTVARLCRDLGLVPEWRRWEARPWYADAVAACAASTSVTGSAGIRPSRCSDPPKPARGA